MVMSDGGSVYPRIILPYGGTPWSTMVSIAAPNILYVGSQNWNAAYYNLRDRTRSDPPKTFSSEWFRIPANAECQIVLRNVARRGGTSNALNIGLYVIDSAGATVKYVRTNAVAAGADPVTVSSSFTTTEEKIIYNMYVRGWSASKYFQASCELWVNGEQWL